MKANAIVFAALTIVLFGNADADEIGYIEEFSLAKDRANALKQLIPGTEDYYYYHCLHYQHTEQFDKVNSLVEDWIKRYKITPRVREIQHRQALLTYPAHPQDSLDYLQRVLNLRFDHQRVAVGEGSQLATRLDPRLIRRETLKKRALERHQNLQGFEDVALDWLIADDLNPDRRRHLLERLARPDYEKLPELVVADLNHKYSKAFGSLPIHQQLLQSQLDACLKQKPELLNQSHFVNTYLVRLQPHADVDWRNDVEQHQAYLERLWAFVERLASVHNSLKANVLYRRLELDRTRGVYDKERFTAYLRLPRNVGYMNAEYMKREDSRRYPADLGRDFSDITLLPTIGDDESLVRAYLQHFFVEETTVEPYLPFVNDQFLNRLLAETKIVNGLGEPEQWFSLMTPTTYQQLKERVDLDFAATNRTVFEAADAVSLDCDVKNVSKLIVKVYHINTRNFYRNNVQEVNTDINLDGLVANAETVHTFTEPPLRRVRRHFEFPELQEPGVYVIDLIGNGKSSRAVIRKGRLRFLVRTSSAGHMFRVLNDQNQPVPGASLWLAGRDFPADDDGTITVPFSNRPGRQPIVLSHQGFHTLAHFDQRAEQYELQAGIYVDRQSLLQDQQAQAIVRAFLTLNGQPVSLSLLEDVKLVATSTDHDGVSTTMEFDNLELYEDRESTVAIQVPPRLARMHFSLQGKVQNLSRRQKIDLAASATYTLNEIDRTEKVEDLHLAWVDGDYHVEVLGKTGELRAGRPVRLSVKHRDFREPVDVSLQSDQRGRIMLGELKDVAWVKATGPEGTSHTWPLTGDQHTYPRSLHGDAGGTVSVAYMGDEKRPTRQEFSLLELRGDKFVADRFAALSLKDGFLQVRALPPGDYDLLLKQDRTRIRLRIAQGARRDAHVLGKTRQLEVRGDAPLQIRAVETGDKNITVRLANASKFARVHVLADRYCQPFHVFPHLGRFRAPEPSWVSYAKLTSLYAQGRTLSDEHDYIIKRQYLKKFPGNMLQRPSLLLNPWAVAKTEAELEELVEGDEFGGRASGSSSSEGGGYGGRGLEHGGNDFSNLDFLANPSAVLTNLVPDKQGVVEVDRDQLGPNQHLHIIAIDPRDAAYRTVSLPEGKVQFRDLRLAQGLDAGKHFTQQKKVSILKADEKVVLSDIATTRFETYDSLARVHALYVTLSKNSHLVDFDFLLKWPKLSPQEQRDKYSEYACHELNFFLSQKDPDFFAEVIRPYLANKRDRTFLDKWLLEENLTEYLQPWHYGRLNVVERILLARRINDEQPHASRHVADLYALLPADAARAEFLFNSAIKGNALDTSAISIGGVVTRNGHKALLDEVGNGIIDLRNARPSVRRLKASELFDTDKLAHKEEALSMEIRPPGEDEQSGKQWKAERYYDDDAAKRGKVRQLYEKLDKTREWVENNYYQLPIERQDAGLVTVNAFWRDYAEHKAGQPFRSPHLAEASRNFTEMMFALSVLDLPLESPKDGNQFDRKTMTLTASGPQVLFHEEIRTAGEVAEQTPILVSQHFFRRGDRYRYVDNEKVDKYVTDEFLVHTVYGCQVVVTNPTSLPQQLDLLLQIPVGALPVLNGQRTRSVHVDLVPYHTQKVEYHFYFPADGQFPHYPVHVSKNEKVLAHADPVLLKVVEKLSRVDRESWDYVSQNGTQDDVLGYMQRNNLHRTDLDKIAFRMGDGKFFKTVTGVLVRRHVYNHTLWSYSIKHGSPPHVREYLQHADSFVSQCGEYLDSPLLSIDPVARKTYQHLDYQPLVNARSHQVGRRRTILNERLHAQYHRLLKLLSYRRDLNDDQLMALTYYMLLQNRIEEALGFFTRVDARNVPTRLQYDYFATYLDFYSERPQRARDIAERYREHPVDRWRNAFAEARQHLDEAAGASPKVLDPDSRSQTQTDLAATAPNFEFQVQTQRVDVRYQNLGQVQVNYYLMDVELLFSRQPFVQQYSGQFANIRPNGSQMIKLPGNRSSHVFAIPEQFHNRNVLIELVGGGQTKTQAYYSNSLSLRLVQNYGQLQVVTADGGKPIPKSYVKVYAKMNDGGTRFFKDGYTDLRGRFDYTSLNTDELSQVREFAMLVISEQHGAVIREAQPPKQ